MAVHPTVVVQVDADLAPSVSWGTPCNHFLRDAIQGVPSVVLLCSLEFEVECSSTRSVGPSDGSRWMVKTSAGLVGWFGFVEVDAHCRDLVEEVVAGECRYRWWLSVVAGCVSQTGELRWVDSEADTQRTGFAAELGVAIGQSVDSERPGVEVEEDMKAAPGRSVVILFEVLVRVVAVVGSAADLPAGEEHTAVVIPC